MQCWCEVSPVDYLQQLQGVDVLGREIVGLWWLLSASLVTLGECLTIWHSRGSEEQDMCWLSTKQLLC